MFCVAKCFNVRLKLCETVKVKINEAVGCCNGRVVRHFNGVKTL